MKKKKFHKPQQPCFNQKIEESKKKAKEENNDKSKYT
jgi:hypothetical protein